MRTVEEANKRGFEVSTCIYSCKLNSLAQAPHTHTLDTVKALHDQVAVLEAHNTGTHVLILTQRKQPHTHTHTTHTQTHTCLTSTHNRHANILVHVLFPREINCVFFYQGYQILEAENTQLMQRLRELSYDDSMKSAQVSQSLKYCFIIMYICYIFRYIYIFMYKTHC